MSPRKPYLRLVAGHYTGSPLNPVSSGTNTRPVHPVSGAAVQDWTNFFDV